MSGDGQFGDQLCVLLRHRVAGGPASRSRVGVGGSFGTGTSNTSQPVEGDMEQAGWHFCHCYLFKKFCVLYQYYHVWFLDEGKLTLMFVSL